MSHTITFAKMEGIGNDFVVANAEMLSEADPPELARRLCARHTAIGADGFLVIGPPSDASCAFRFRMYNPDGSEDMCGNGMRCAVLYAKLCGLVPTLDHPVVVETIAGRVTAQLLSLGATDKSATVRVEMPIPNFAPAAIPFADTETDKAVDYPVYVGDAPVKITALNTGSTHSVIFCDGLPDNDEFFTIGPLLERHPYFPERTSVIWAAQSGVGEFTIRIWERSAGETLGCGTGACAVAAAATIKGLANYGDEIEVASKGGCLTLQWPAPDSPMQMTGPARWVYEGVQNLAARS